MTEEFVSNAVCGNDVREENTEPKCMSFLSFNKGLHDDELDRIVFSDRGSFKDKDGKVYHKVVMAFACDMKVIGDNIPVTNPYLVNRKSSTGFVDHYIRLNDVLFNRLMAFANTDGLMDVGWTGVINGRVKVRDESTTVLDLSDYGELVKPDVPFNFAKHIAFINASITGVGFVKRRRFYGRLFGRQGSFKSRGFTVKNVDVTKEVAESVYQSFEDEASEE